MLNTRKILLIVSILAVVIITAIVVEQRHQIHTSDFPNYEQKMQSQVVAFRENIPVTGIQYGEFEMGVSFFKSEKYPQTYKILEPYAMAGSPQAILIIGYLNEFGLGRAQNMKAAALWYYQAIHHNNYNDAAIARGVKYFFGIDGTKVDYAESAQWFRMAAELSVDAY